MVCGSLDAGSSDVISTNLDPEYCNAETRVSSAILPSVHILSGAKNADDTATVEQNLATEYGLLEAVKNIQKGFLECGYADTQIHRATLDNYKDLLDQIQETAQGPFVLLNLCDGTEADGYPGISVVKEIENRRLPFTGADSRFYDITTSKTIMKDIMIAAGVPTSPFGEIMNPKQVEEGVDKAIERIGPDGWPLFVKPSVSYASVGISDNSVVHSREEAIAQVNYLYKEMPEISAGGVFIERFLNGREFTALVVGEGNEARVVQVGERTFKADVPQEKRFFAFDRYWDGFTVDSKLEDGNEKQIYKYLPTPPEIKDRLAEAARAAYVSVGGNGYGRIDMRTDSTDITKANVFVLEVNSNPGLSFDMSSSCGELLAMSKEPLVRFVNVLIHSALSRPVKY